MARTAEYDIIKAQREYDRAADAYSSARSDYASGINRDDAQLSAAYRRMIDAEAALVAVSRCY